MKYAMYFLLLCCCLSVNSIASYNEEKIDTPKKAFITGVTGQDGSYLAELLLEKGYEVHSIFRKTNNAEKQHQNEAFIAEMEQIGTFIAHNGEITDKARIISLIAHIQPDEIYHLAAQTHIPVSLKNPSETIEINVLATYYLLEAIEKAGIMKKVKLFQASSSAIFGQSVDMPQTEATQLNPNSPYAISKMCAQLAVKNYREMYGLFACNGILFNHESPRRGTDFVTRKITLAVANIVKGSKEILRLGNLDALRDWGYAPDYVEAMWHMLQQDSADDYIIATGKTHTVRNFVTAAFNAAHITINWQGNGVNEKGVDATTGKVLVEVDPQFFRPLEHVVSIGSIEKITKKIGWLPKTSFEELVQIMVASDLAL